MRRNAVLLGAVAGTAAAGTAAAIVVRLRRASSKSAVLAPSPDPRAEDLRRKLAEAREQAADETEFEAAGMAAEALVEDEPAAPAVTRPVDEQRRRVHEEARAAAEEMRRAGEAGGT